MDWNNTHDQTERKMPDKTKRKTPDQTERKTPYQTRNTIRFRLEGHPSSDWRYIPDQT